MKVSVIMPAYNRELYITEAIQSILNQTMEDFELLVLDDASTDGTRDRVRMVHDERVRLIEMPFKSNVPILRQAGIGLAKGEYIAYMDSDDISMPDRLQVECDYLDSHPEYGIVSGNYEFFGNFSKFYDMPKGHTNIVTLLLLKSTIANGASMFRKSLVTEQKVCLRTEYFVCEDYAFWVDLIGKTKMENIDQTFLKVRSGHSSITQESWQDAGKLRLRKAVLDEIHRTAFQNLGIPVTEEEINEFNRYVGDANRYNVVTKEDVKRIEKVFSSIIHKIHCCEPVLDFSPAILEAAMKEKVIAFKQKASKHNN